MEQLPLVHIQATSLILQNRPFFIEYFIRRGRKDTILFVHGLGGAKENFWEACQATALKDYTLICFDNPGTGNSTYYEDVALQVDDLVELISLFIKELKLSNFFLAGASMGGLVTMLYLQRNKEHEIKGYINIEGNLMPEDCTFSGKVVMYSYEQFRKDIFWYMIKNMKSKGNTGYHVIANNLELNTNIKAYYDYSFQTVAYSNSDLFNYYLGISIPRIFIYGEKNLGLSYLPAMKNANMNMEMIPDSDHFIFYDNPAAMYNVIEQFICSNHY